MKKQYLTLILFVFAIYSCVAHKTPYKLELKKELKQVIDSFTNKYENFQFYELYIDKTTPYNLTLILFGGDNSLMEQENSDYNQQPIVYMLSSNNKRVYIYSGIERYVLNSFGNSVKRNKVRNYSNSICWMIEDSFNTFSTIDSICGRYPFFPLPMKFIPPPMIEDSVQENDNLSF